MTLLRLRARRILPMLITGTPGRDRCRAIVVPRCKELPGPDGYCPGHRGGQFPARPA